MFRLHIESGTVLHSKPCTSAIYNLLVIHSNHMITLHCFGDSSDIKLLQQILHSTTLCSKKERHQTHGVNSVNSQPIFKIFFAVRFSSKFAAKDLLKIPSHLICVAALTCKTLMSIKSDSHKLMQ